MAIETATLLCDRHRAFILAERDVRLARAVILCSMANTEEYRNARREGSRAVGELLERLTPLCCELGDDYIRALAERITFEGF